MAIAYDNSLARQNTASTTLTVSYTVTGTNPALVVYIEHPTSSTVTCTYAGVSMNAVDSAISGGLGLVTSFLLVGCATGANNIVATRTGGINDMSLMAASYTGVTSGSSAGGSDAHNTQVWSSDSSNHTLTTTTVSDNAWISMFTRTGASYSAGTNFTVRKATSTVVYIGDTNAGITPAGATGQTITYNSGGPANGTIASIALKPYATGGSTFIPRISFIM